jgi:hypothetical protein
VLLLRAGEAAVLLLRGLGGLRAEIENRHCSLPVLLADVPSDRDLNFDRCLVDHCGLSANLTLGLKHRRYLCKTMAPPNPLSTGPAPISIARAAAQHSWLRVVGHGGRARATGVPRGS